MFQTLTSIFSNRELATGFWLLILLCYCIIQPSIRRALGHVARALFQIRIVVLFFTLACWLTIGIFTLWQVGWWTTDQLKLSIFWYLFSGTVMLTESVQNKRNANFLHGLMAEQIKAVALLEFIVVFYSFALWKEIIFLPFMAIIIGMQTLSGLREEYAAVKKIMDAILILVGFIIIFHFVRTAISNHGTLLNLTTLRELTIPVIYTIWGLPFCYIWWCVARWERARLQINNKDFHTENLRSFARNKFFWAFFLKPVLLKRAVEQFNSLPAKSQEDVRNIITKVRTHDANRRNPKPVETKYGWCPIAAEKFLSAAGYETDDFHDTCRDGEWFAESPPTNLRRDGLFGSLIYRIKGQEGVVKTVQIIGSFSIDPASDATLEQMENLCLSLTRAATDQESMPGQIVNGFKIQRDAHHATNHHRFTLKFRRYQETHFLDVEFICIPLGN